MTNLCGVVSKVNEETPLVSVIVPTYNSAGTLGRCLGSVESQTYPDVEIIVVDNYSKDATREIAKKCGVRIFLKGPERSAQRNFGTKQANGKYLIFLDSDITLSAKVVTECMSKVNEGYRIITFPEIIVGEGFWARCRALEARCYLGDNEIEAPRFYDKNVFDKLNGFDESLTGTEDWDLREKATKKGFRIGRIRALTVHYEGRVSLIARLKSKYYYGKTVDKYIKKNRIAIKQIPLLRSCYYRNWKLLANDPFHAIGFVFLKMCETFAVIVALVAKNR